MASADYHSGIPVLPATPPQTETTPMVLVDCCMLGAGWVAPRWPWDDGGRHGQEELLAAMVHHVLLIDMCLVLDLCIGMVLTYRRSTLLIR